MTSKLLSIDCSSVVTLYLTEANKKQFRVRCNTLKHMKNKQKRVHLSET
jgi:hypothetical protein